VNLEQLRARRGEIVKELKAILELAKAENREITAEEEKRFTALETEETRVKASIARLERVAASESELAQPTREAPLERPDPSAGRPPAVHIREERPYSLFRLFNAQVSGRWSEARVEQRIGDLLTERLGPPLESRSVHVPYRALLPLARQAELDRKDPLERHLMREHRISHPAGDLLEKRDVDSTTGASLIAVDLAVSEFIELLRNEASVVAAGARMLPNLVGTLDIPRQNAAATGGWIATETGSPSESNLTTDKITLAPKTFGVRQEITRRMSKQASPGAEDLVREDIRQVIGIGIDLGAISGSGASGQPTGITVISGTGSVACAGALTATLANILAFETALGTANALRGRPSWLMRSAARGALKSTAKAANVVAGFLMEMNGEMNGYRSFVTEQAPASAATGAIIFGNFAELLIGMWGVLDLFADPYTLGNSGGIVVRGFQDLDIGIRHAASFARSTVF